jgi:hypothetical protein
MSRTWRVATNDTANENANSPKNSSVKSKLLFPLKQPAFQLKLAERTLLQTKFFYHAQEIRNIWLQELYIFRLAVCKCFQQQDGLACRHGRLISGIWRRGQNRAGFPGVLPALASE